MNYGFSKQVIHNLNEVNINDSTSYYHYNEVDFYYKKIKNDDNLVVAFHGATNNDVSLPVFRCYNWNYNILCISDHLLQKYPGLLVGWYCTEKGSNIDMIYIDIIKFFMIHHTNIIFYGTSAGGFPSLFYATLFHKKAFISNSQLYLDNYHPYNKFLGFVNDKNLTHSIHADEIIDKHGLPYMMYIYVNINDSHSYINHFVPFMKYVNDNQLNQHFKFVAFNGEDPPPDKTPHHIYTPSNITTHQIINELFLYNKNI